MTERCPLQVGRQYSDGGYSEFQIPEICLRRCLDILPQTSEDELDDFGLRHGGDWDNEGEPCSHDVEHAGETLERVGPKSSAERGHAVISACIETGEEAFSTYNTFMCSNN